MAEEKKRYVIITMPVDLRREIDELVGADNFSAFINEAVDRELQRRRQSAVEPEQMRAQERVYIN
jgi:hypothetical protein